MGRIVHVLGIGRAVASAAPRDEREPAILQRPLVGWTAAGVTAEGRLDVERTSDWIGTPCTAAPCPHPGPDAALTDAGGVAAEHTAPAPYCECGLAAYGAGPQGRWRDRYRDRLGYRMQAAALVATWGRVIVESDRVRGAHGRVLALLVAKEEPARRRDRVDHAARHLGAEVVEFSDDRAPDFRAIAERIGAERGDLLGRAAVGALQARDDVRRWRTTSRGHVYESLFPLYGIAFGAGLTGVSLDALGVSDAAIAAIVGVPSAVLLARHHRSAMRGFVQVEALAPSPGGEHVGQPIRLHPSRAASAALS